MCGNNNDMIISSNDISIKQSARSGFMNYWNYLQ